MGNTGVCRLPHDVRMECVYLVRGYERRKKDYLREVEEIIGSAIPTLGDGVQNPGTADPTGRKAALIAGLEEKEEVKKLRAVGRALAEMEPELRTPLIRNISSRTPFISLGVEGYSEMTFKRRRRKLLFLVAKERGYIG